jgi:hypothetical protein
MKNVLDSFISVVRVFQGQPTIALQTSVDHSYFATPGSGLNSRINTGSSFNSRKMGQFFKKSPYIPVGLVVLIVIVIAFVVLKGISGKPTTQPVAANQQQQVQLPAPVAQEALNKSFTFPLKDTNGKELSQLQYVIQNAEIDNQIIIKGEKAVAVKGREFLILNLKITNNYSKSINLNTRDYIRLSVNNSSEKLAPDIHNDPVEVQAISTKYTRVGFAINTSDRNLTLQVGEINGPKQEIKLNLQ